MTSIRILKTLAEDSKDKPGDLQLFRQLFKESLCRWTDDCSRNMLMLALRNGHLDIFSYIIEKCSSTIDFTTADMFNQNILHYLAISRENNREIVDFLFTNMSKVLNNANNNSSVTADSMFANLIWTRSKCGWYPDQMCTKYGNKVLQQYFYELRTEEYAWNRKYGFTNSDLHELGENDRKFMFGNGVTEDGDVDRRGGHRSYGKYDDNYGNSRRTSYSSYGNNYGYSRRNSDSSYGYGRAGNYNVNRSSSYNNNNQRWRMRESDHQNGGQQAGNRYNSTPRGRSNSGRDYYSNRVVYGNEQKMNGNQN